MPIANLEAKLNDFAIRTFRDTADRDYVHARLAYRASLIPQFLWSSLHCLEKYMKGVLLLNRIECHDVSHAVTPLLQKLTDSRKFVATVSPKTSAFIQRLEGMGEFRYFQVSYFNLHEDLEDLDRAVWELRRYCQPLDHSRLPSARSLPSLALELQRVNLSRDQNAKGTCILGGWLESVISAKNHRAREPLIWNNLHFGPSHRKKVKKRAWEQAGNAPLYMHPELTDEVCKYIRLERHIAQMWRQEAVARKRAP